MNNDLSDEEFWKWHDSHALRNCVSFGASLLAWQECRRRAKALIEQAKRQAYAAGWEAVSVYAGDQGPRDMLVDPDMARDRACKEYMERNK